jgi:hypothetical protein
MKTQKVSAYEAWTEAERLANRAEHALGDILANGHVPSDELSAFVSQRRRGATESLILWLLDVESTGRRSRVESEPSSSRNCT